MARWNIDPDTGRLERMVSPATKTTRRAEPLNTTCTAGRKSAREPDYGTRRAGPITDAGVRRADRALDAEYGAAASMAERTHVQKHTKRAAQKAARRAEARAWENAV